ncbi:protein enabled homolog [Mastomys coucha]|uniref:protein enabled homolog n=1 Tax=Mastomys coucha TaxID=35658 RepID=UPI00126203DF|nr:protein enabled homolog [Mastomys coucha]
MRSRTTQVQDTTTAPPFLRGLALRWWPTPGDLVLGPIHQELAGAPFYPPNPTPQDIEPPPHPLPPWDIILPVPLTSSLSYFPEGSPCCSGHSSSASAALGLPKIGKGARGRASAHAPRGPVRLRTRRAPRGRHTSTAGANHRGGGG